MKQMKKPVGKILGILLTLVMVVGLMPCISQTTFAGYKKAQLPTATAYSDYIPTEADDEESLAAKVIKFNDMDWYLIEDDSTSEAEGTVTLFAKDSVGDSKFNNNRSDGNAYSTSKIKTFLDGMTAEYGSFASVADAIQTVKVKGSDSDVEVDAKLYLLSVSEAEELPEAVRNFNSYWWLRTPGTAGDDSAACVKTDGTIKDYGSFVTYNNPTHPALKLDLSKVEFDVDTKTFVVPKTPYGEYIPVESDDEEALSSKVIKFNDMDWYLIEDNSTSKTEGTVTLFAKDSVGDSTFNDDSSDGNAYSTSKVKTFLDGLAAKSGSFGRVAHAIETVKVKGSDSDVEVDAKLYLLSVSEAEPLPQAVRKFSSYWWLRTPGTRGDDAAACVRADGTVKEYGSVMTYNNPTRPALKLDLNRVEFDSVTKTFTAKTIGYPLWVDGVQVTNENMDDVLGDKDEGATVTFTPRTIGSTPTPPTLTLNGANITTGYEFIANPVGVYYIGEDDLNVELASGSDNTIENVDIGMYSENDDAVITINGTGKLTANGTMHGLFVAGTINIDSGKVSAFSTTDRYTAMEATKMAISGGELTASNVCDNGIGLASDEITISGGCVTAVGGGNAIIDATVKNYISGIGWANKEGTAGKTDIAINKEGQNLSAYKKVQFPGEVTVKFDSVGGSAVKAQTIKKGTKATKPANPTKAGYTFVQWTKDGKAFNFNSVIEDNITLVAQWKENSQNISTKKAEISINAGLKVTQKGSKIKVKWGKVKEAAGYDVYLAYCSKKFGKPIKKVKKNTVKAVRLGKIGKKKINLKKNFKVYVAAYKIVNGKKVRIAKSIIAHVVGHKNAKYTNPKKIKLAKKKYTVAVGKTVKVKAKTVLVNKKKKKLSNKHAKEFRYATTNNQVATISKKGKIKGVKKGTCTIYVYARNGFAKKVAVIVK